MSQDDGMPTLGRLLDRQARRIAARHLPEFAWADGFAVLLRRMQRLTAPQADRFARFETVSVGDLPKLRAPAADQSDEHERSTTTRPVPAQEVPSLMRAPHAAAAIDVPADGALGVDAAGGSTPVPARPSAGQRLPGDVADRLRRIVGPAADALVVHTDGPANTLARAEHADAVTLGTDVHFRQDQYRPRHTEGFALLAHEATHVAASQTAGNAWRRYAAGADEEARALAREHASLRHEGPTVTESARPPVRTGGDTGHTAAGHAFGGAPSGFAASPPASFSMPAHSQTQTSGAVPGAGHTAMRAEADRPRTAEPPQGIDVDRLRRDLLDDLKRQLRTEFERGG